MPKEHKSFKIDFLTNHSSLFAETRERAKEVGLATAFAEKMQAANIHIKFEGNTSFFNKVGSPTLFIGNHATGFENVIMLAAFGSFLREDVKFATKPYTFTNHLIVMLGQDENSYTIPLIPQTMAKDRSGGAIILKHLFTKDLLTRNEIKTQNMKSLQIAAKELNKGSVVVIYPTGEINDARSSKWFSGVGEVIKMISPEKRNSVNIVPFFCEGIQPLNLVRAFLSSSLGNRPKEQNITIHLGKQDTIKTLFDDHINLESASPNDITEILRQQFISDFPIGGKRRK